MKGEKTDANPWADDLLGYDEIGAAFTNLIQSIDDAKVISIEAGFGRGKTFFRERWAKQLKAAGETVIEIDAQKSDHSGDPVVTFLGALMEALPPQERSAWLTAWATGKKLAWGGVKLGVSVVGRKAGEELAEAAEGLWSEDRNTDLEDVIGAFGKGVSKALSEHVIAQLSAERVRTQEMPG
ncbi:hypothetical protein J4E08_16125 [Sagittula sp. NFXS13]|uniref:P-loop NTPase fold protein n=1 Tax=Sagittula sp. NFXS13 TaxID=2819095 RepID=UPI0032E054FF